MCDMYGIIEGLCRDRGIRPGKLCADLGISRGIMSDLKAGRTKQLSVETVGKIASYFGVSVGFLLGKETTPIGSSVDYLLGRDMAPDSPPSPSMPGSQWIPVLGKVAAGIPIEAIEDTLEYEEISEQIASSGEFFALQIKGKSMEPRIREGDVVVVRKQGDCDTGDIAVVLVNGDEATVKRIKKEPGGIMLVPNNPAYEPVFYSNEQIEKLPVQIIGKVIELRAKF